jgi:hypothetical protein
MGSNCSTCINTNKYPYNSSLAIGTFPSLNVRNTSVSGHSVKDMACLIDSQGAKQCTDMLNFGVIDTQSGIKVDIDGVLGLSP